MSSTVPDLDELTLLVFLLTIALIRVCLMLNADALIATVFTLMQLLQRRQVKSHVETSYTAEYFLFLTQFLGWLASG